MTSADGALGRSSAGAIVARGSALLALAALMGFIGILIPPLWDETRSLIRESSSAEDRSAVGYIDIHPLPSFAARPREWLRDEGDDLLLWAGWSPEQQQHRWFRVARGQLDTERLHGPMGRDVIRAIDRTFVEAKGGAFWSRIPSSADVASIDIQGISTAYPWRVLEKVEVVNDEIADRPILVTFTPFRETAESVRVYDPKHRGRRLTMGSSGYFAGQSPLLYDRGTESLWVASDDGLRAVAGTLKGATLPMLARLSPTRWSAWAGSHPGGRVVIGADRRVARPSD